MRDNDYSNELDIILKRIRNEANQKTESESEKEPLEPPKTREEMQEPPADEPAPETLEWQTAEEAAASERKKARKVFLRPAVIRANFKTRLLPAVKRFLGKILTRQFFLALGALVLIAALVFGGVKLYDYSKTAYLRPYIEKYGIEYPAGIREEFCDDYGKDQSTQGRLVIEDSATDTLISSKSVAVPDKGSTVLKDQHIRSVSLSRGNLETCYADPADFVNASQKVTFKTLFGDEEYRVAAAYYTNINPDLDGGYVFPYNACGNMTKRSFKSYLDWVKNKSAYRTGVECRYDDYYLSINTPATAEDDARFVILCVRVREGEEFEKTTKTKENKRVLKTQAYYDERGEVNPFRFAEHWYPEVYTDAAMTKTKRLSAKDFTND